MEQGTKMEILSTTQIYRNADREPEDLVAILPYRPGRTKGHPGIPMVCDHTTKN
jgi:hypothetical protein